MERISRLSVQQIWLHKEDAGANFSARDPRNGRSLANLGALLDEHIGDVTVNNIKKELLIHELPQVVRH